MATKKVYLVDTENVGSTWKDLLPVKSGTDQILLFFTENSPYVSYLDLQLILQFPDRFEMIKCNPGKNGLDFQLVSYLGYLMKTASKANYVIVSNDGGFDAVVKFWQDRGMSISRMNVHRALQADAGQAARSTAAPAKQDARVANPPAKKTVPGQKGGAKNAPAPSKNPGTDTEKVAAGSASGILASTENTDSGAGTETMAAAVPDSGNNDSPAENASEKTGMADDSAPGAAALDIGSDTAKKTAARKRASTTKGAARAKTRKSAQNAAPQETLTESAVMDESTNTAKVDQSVANIVSGQTIAGTAGEEAGGIPASSEGVAGTVDSPVISNGVAETGNYSAASVNVAESVDNPATSTNVAEAAGNSVISKGTADAVGNADTSKSAADAVGNPVISKGAADAAGNPDTSISAVEAAGSPNVSTNAASAMDNSIISNGAADATGNPVISKGAAGATGNPNASVSAADAADNADTSTSTADAAGSPATSINTAETTGSPATSSGAFEPAGGSAASEAAPKAKSTRAKTPRGKKAAAADDAQPAAKTPAKRQRKSAPAPLAQPIEPVPDSENIELDFSNLTVSEKAALLRKYLPKEFSENPEFLDIISDIMFGHDTTNHHQLHLAFVKNFGDEKGTLIYKAFRPHLAEFRA